jgi:hypothetical protein
MMRFKLSAKSVAIAGGISVLAGGLAFAGWQFGKNQSCLRMVSAGSPEIIYSMGCVNPQRYRRWTITAQRQAAERTAILPGEVAPSKSLLSTRP